MTLIMDTNACLLHSEYIYHITTVVNFVCFKSPSCFSPSTAVYRDRPYLFFSISGQVVCCYDKHIQYYYLQMCIVSCARVTYKMRFGLDGWIYCTLCIHTTRDCRQYSAFAIAHTFISTLHTH
jgi:hypothetical protein